MCRLLVEQILFNTFKAISFFFLNPLWATALVASIVLGYVRVKQERSYFKVRLMPGLTECKRLLSESWVQAVFLSIIISGVGLVVDFGWLVLFAIFSLLFLLTFYYKITSPIYAVTAAFFTIFFLSYYVESFTYRGWSASSIDLFGSLAVTVPVIGGLFLIVEGMLLRKSAVKDPSPALVQTKRGLWAAIFKSKKLWLLPIVFVVPGDMIASYVPYWPQFTLGSTAFSFIPFPLVIGFSQVARATYPDELFPKMGRAIIVTGGIVILAGIGAMWMPILGWTALIIGVVGRMTITIFTSIRERVKPLTVMPQSSGVVLAGVIPGSPGEKMGLVPGECIRSVNGQNVTNIKELYNAIQINAAHCRLQVLDRQGEARLMQQVIYRHDHHRLGLLVIR